MFFFFLGIKSEVKVRKEQFFNMRIKYVLQGVIFHSHFFNQQMVSFGAPSVVGVRRTE